MVVIVLGLIWKKVPAAIGKALDSKIDVIRQQLSEAETLRKDAEALKAEYEKKAKAADKEAASIVERAKHEAEAIVAQAKDNADALVDRRQRMLHFHRLEREQSLPFNNFFTSGNFDCGDLAGHRSGDRSRGRTPAGYATARCEAKLVGVTLVEGDDALIVAKAGYGRKLALVRRNASVFTTSAESNLRSFRGI